MSSSSEIVPTSAESAHRHVDVAKKSENQKTFDSREESSYGRVRVEINGRYRMSLPVFTFSKFKRLLFARSKGLGGGPVSVRVAVSHREITSFEKVVTGRRSAPWPLVRHVYNGLRHKPFTVDHRDVAMLHADVTAVEEMMRDRYVTLRVPEDVISAEPAGRSTCVVYVRREYLYTYTAIDRVWMKASDVERVVGKSVTNALSGSYRTFDGLIKGFYGEALPPKHLFSKTGRWDAFVGVNTLLKHVRNNGDDDGLVKWLKKIRLGNACPVCSPFRTQLCHETLCRYVSAGRSKVFYAYYLENKHLFGHSDTSFSMSFGYRHDFTSIVGVSFKIGGSKIFQRKFVDLQDDTFAWLSQNLLTLVYYFEMMADIYRLLTVSQTTSCMSRYTAIKFHCRMIGFFNRTGRCRALGDLCDRVLQRDFWPTEKWFFGLTEADNNEEETSVLKQLMRICGGHLADSRHDCELVYGDEITLISDRARLASTKLLGTTVYGRQLQDALDTTLDLDVPAHAALSDPVATVTAPIVKNHSQRIPGYTFL